MRASGLVWAALLCIAPVSAAAADQGLHDYIVSGGPWSGLSVPCVKTTVLEVAPRLTSSQGNSYTKADFSSGVQVNFKLPRGYKFINTPHLIGAAVVHYQGEPENALMMSERPGDAVQVCLMDYPSPQYDAKQKRWICNPDTDARGYGFRVYDYKRHRAYFGSNTQHGCGGA